ncbi:MAG: hypothetical protein J6Y08_01750 [Clostridiales bacterium]|nr:hypothetical protein [Clostridiales bacterium]
MKGRKFLIGFLIFDIVAVLGIAVYLLIKNPFKVNVAPNTEPESSVTASASRSAAFSGSDSVDMDSMKILMQAPGLVGMREESSMTEDGLYYTAFKAYLDLDMDGDGTAESVSISLDEPSCSFYVLVIKDGVAYDYVLPGTCFDYNETYGAKVCKGGIRGFTTDLDNSDSYTEVGVELMRDTWEEYKTIVVRFDGSSLLVSEVGGKLCGISNAGTVQFTLYDPFTGEHKLYRTYEFTSSRDFLDPLTPYFADLNVEKTSFSSSCEEPILCQNLSGESVELPAGKIFYMLQTDYETYVDVITSDNYVFRLPITVEEIEYESGKQKVYHLGDKYAEEIF